MDIAVQAGHRGKLKKKKSIKVDKYSNFAMFLKKKKNAMEHESDGDSHSS